MGLIRSILEDGNLRASAPDPTDDFWYRPAGDIGGLGAAGVGVTQDSALRISTVWACATLISEAIGSLPLITYRRLDNGGKERAPEHPIYGLLHDTPNGGKQTAPEFVGLLTLWALLRGNGYARILAGPRGPVDSLEVLSPDRCWPRVAYDGTLTYEVRDPFRGTSEVVNAEDIFHLKGPSLDGVWGMSVVSHARTSFSKAIAAEEYGARFFGQSARPGGILTTDQRLKEATVKRVQEQWHETYGGLPNAHKTAVLEQGLKFEPVSMSMEDAQFIQSQEFSVSDVARWFRVPEPLIGITSKGTVWGTGIESMGIHFLTYCLGPWIGRWQAAIRGKLILAPQTYFAEFLTDALMRGDTPARFGAYQIAAGGNAPWMTRNEIRVRENMTPLDGLDEPLAPLNMGAAGAADAGPQQGGGQVPTDGLTPAEQAADLRPFVRDAAGRVLRREVAALGKLARRTARGQGPTFADDAAWEGGVADFYREHALFVAEAMHLDVVTAANWCADQVDDLLDRPHLLDAADWEAGRADALAALALGGER
jgi:HK97 family phage portal protein